MSARRNQSMGRGDSARQLGVPFLPAAGAGTAGADAVAAAATRWRQETLD